MSRQGSQTRNKTKLATSSVPSWGRPKRGGNKNGFTTRGFLGPRCVQKCHKTTAVLGVPKGGRKSKWLDRSAVLAAHELAKRLHSCTYHLGSPKTGEKIKVCASFLSSCGPMGGQSGSMSLNTLGFLKGEQSQSSRPTCGQSSYTTPTSGMPSWGRAKAGRISKWLHKPWCLGAHVWPTLQDNHFRLGGPEKRGQNQSK